MIRHRSYRSWGAATLLVAVGCSESPSAPPTGQAQAGTSAGQAGGTNTSGGGSSGGGSAAVAGGGGAGAPPAAGAGGAGTLAGAGGAAGTSGGGGVGTGCSGKALCWDFEEGSVPAGFKPYRNQPGGELLVDDTKAYGGSKFALHAKGIVGQQPQKSLTYQLPEGFGPVLWGRAFVFTTPVRPAAHAGLFAAYYPRPGSSDTAMTALDWFEVASFQEAYMGIWHPPWPPGFPEAVYVSDTLVVLDRWVCLEWQFDGVYAQHPTEAGPPRVWVDSVELAWPQKFGFAEPQGMSATLPPSEKVSNFTVIEVGMTLWQAMPAANDWWIDDLGVGPERLGCQ